MSTRTPRTEPPPRPIDLAAWRPARRTWLWVLLAFFGGLLLFALVLSNKGDDAGETPDGAPTATGPSYLPLPAPLPAGADSTASGMNQQREATPAPDAGDERPRLVETAPPPPEPVAAAAPAGLPAAAASQPVPIPGQTPSPRYPMTALRRGERGTVLVSAQIGSDGVPISVGVVQSSGSRSLDRAATDAVRRWRFRPAEREGQPTSGTVYVPIEFNPG